MSDHNPSNPILSCTVSSFTQRLLHVNGLDTQEFVGWFLPPGMSFAATSLWWGRQKPRPRPHEGLDLKFFSTKHGGSCTLEAGTMIPTLFSGKIAAIFPDLISQSVLIAHAQEGLGRLYSLYAHIVPDPTLTIGQYCSEGEIIGQIARCPQPDVPTHLHLSTFRLAGALTNDVNWPELHQTSGLTWCDPLPFLRR
ncbi:MAG: hypothetical protein PHI06_05300 [Desulfobulbaceae bacterium]|nr:hypothetical protein [Desulfobulbaceae bacterium]